ncbi:MAG: hypothetical protein V4463_03180 [Pseudomonadota bacterium]
MKHIVVACMAAGALGGGAAAAELAYTVRPTELKAKPFTDASTLSSLAEAAKVDVLGRQASWIQVKSDKSTGWVKMLSLRFDQMGAAPSKGMNSNLNVIFNIAQTGSGGSTPTTGVKGVSEEAFKNPHANPAALAQMNEMTVSQADALAFAKAGKLGQKSMDYLPKPVVPATPDTGAKK